MKVAAADKKPRGKGGEERPENNEEVPEKSNGELSVGGTMTLRVLVYLDHFSRAVWADRFPAMSISTGAVQSSFPHHSMQIIAIDRRVEQKQKTRNSLASSTVTDNRGGRSGGPWRGDANVISGDHLDNSVQV